MRPDAAARIDGPIVVLGGGPTGLTCALLLAAHGLRCLVVDARPLDAALDDPRLLALARGTWRILAPLLAGAEPPPTAAITDVHVSSAGEFGATRLSTADFAVEPGTSGTGAPDALGATVAYGDLLRALAARVSMQALIEVRRPLRVAAVAQHPQCVQVAFADGSAVRTALLVHAEGSHDARASGPTAADDARATGRRSPADDAHRPWAVLADLVLQGPAPGTAFERFTREGPLALLPSPRAQASADGAPYSLVWCMREGEAQRRAALPDERFIAELQAAVGARIGRVQAAGPRRRAPLPSGMRERVREHRSVWLGNAAQTLHPVAGQGFNLGVRDCATLARCLSSSRNDAIAALAAYAAQRRADRRTIEAVTRWLPGVFATTFAPMALARTIGLAALDVLPPARREFARLLMFGVRG